MGFRRFSIDHVHHEFLTMKKFAALLAFVGLVVSTQAQTDPYATQPYVYFDSSGNIIPFKFGKDAINQYNLIFPSSVSSGEQAEVAALPQFNNEGISGQAPTITVGPIFPPGPGSPSNFISADVAKSANFSVSSSQYAVMFQVTTSSSNITATLPSASTLPDGWYCMIRKADAGSGVVLNSALSDSVAAQGHVTLYWTDGTSWYGRAWYGGWSTAGLLTITAPAGIQSSSFLGTSPSLGVGYTAGSGGAVTQITSRTTGVALNKVAGEITLYTAAGSASWTSFTVTDTSVAAADTVNCSVEGGTTDTYIAVGTAIATAGGSFKISFLDLTGTTSETPVINFTVHKGSAD